MENERLWASALGFNIMMDASIGTMVEMAQKHPQHLDKQQLKDICENIINKYWKEGKSSE